MLQQARQFAIRADELGLEQDDWSVYEVNVQGGFSFESAARIIEQCSDSPLAYYWPIALEVTAAGQEAKAAPGAKPEANKGDVQITVKGHFVARKQ